MKVFVTKYALTSGIQEFDSVEPDKIDPNMICVRTGGFSSYFHGEGKEWHLTMDGAASRSNLMRSKKIAAMEKAIERLRSLEF